MNKNIKTTIPAGTAKPMTSAITETAEPEEIVYLACPRCLDQKLEEMVTKESRFLQCAHCGGIWFGLNELEKALGKNVKFALPTGALPAEYVPRASKPLCPTCQANMVHIKALDIPDLGVEACLICQGRWLDGQEVSRLQNRGLLKQLKNFVMRLF